MPSETAIVHVIDDDEALRNSLAFLLRTADLEVMSHASAAAFLDVLPLTGLTCIITDVRMPGLERYRPAAPREGARHRGAGDRHHRPWRCPARGRSHEVRRGRFPRKTLRRRDFAAERAGGAAPTGRRRPSGRANARRSKAGWRRCRRANATCLAAWSPAAPTSRSPSSSASARAPSRFTAPISWTRCRPEACPTWCAWR